MPRMSWLKYPGAIMLMIGVLLAIDEILAQSVAGVVGAVLLALAGFALLVLSNDGARPRS